MKWADLLMMLDESPVFTSAMLMAGQESPRDVRRQLNRWVHAGKVLPLRRGVYALAPPYARKQAHPFVVANVLRKGSYVSLQSALGYYGLIPEYVPATTSVTTRRPEQLTTPLGDFSFHHVKTGMVFGYGRVEVSPGQHALVASPEKALIDLLYLTPGSDQDEYLRQLRIEKSPQLDNGELLKIGKHAPSLKVARAIDRLVALWDAEEAYTEL